MRVKICGITRVVDALFAEKAGADAIGVVMCSPTSRRSVPESKTREIFDALGPFVTRVVVTHTESKDDLKKILALRRTRSRSRTRLFLNQTRAPGCSE